MGTRNFVMELGGNMWSKIGFWIGIWSFVGIVQQTPAQGGNPQGQKAAVSQQEDDELETGQNGLVQEPDINGLHADHRDQLLEFVQRFQRQNQTLPKGWDQWDIDEMAQRIKKIKKQKKELDKELPDEATPQLTEPQKQQMADQMSRTHPKWYVEAGQFYDPKKHPQISNRLLQLTNQQQLTHVPEDHRQDPLIGQAQQKITPSFHQYVCKTQWAKWLKVDCDKFKDREKRAFIGQSDRPEALTDGWLLPQELEYDLEKIRTSGSSALPLWSDDYWRIQWGITSYRYQSGAAYENWEEAVSAYSQPTDNLKADITEHSELSWVKRQPAGDTGWFDILGKFTLLNQDSIPGNAIAKIADLIDTVYSPAEKYDLIVGDNEFTLTNEQKRAGFSQAKTDDSGHLVRPVDVEAWMGICHGWAPAAYMVPRPMKPVVVSGPVIDDEKGTKGVEVTLGASDIRALVSLAWANGSPGANFVGGRCNVKKPQTYPNGRIKQQECFDNNPATFTYALAWMIGQKRVSFVMDKTFDYEVWNQPIESYDLTFFRPTKNPRDRANWSKNPREVWVDYKEYRKQDRFQHPKYGTRTKDTNLLKKMKIVGAVLTVDYLVETNPTFPRPPDDQKKATMRVNQVYDLELLPMKNGAYQAVGGEWWENNHPDFLWTPAEHAVASMGLDKRQIQVQHGANHKLSFGVNEAMLDNTIRPASNNAYPLCHVLRPLLEKSAGPLDKNVYVCR